MKSFLANLAARAHGLAEVVQPRPRALFEPDASGGNDPVSVADRPPAATPLRNALWSEPPPAEPRLGARVVEIERLFAAPPPVEPATVAVAGASGTPPPVAAAVQPALVEPPVPPGPEVETRISPSLARAEAAPAVRPVIHLHRAKPAPGPPSPFAAVPPPVPAAVHAPPSVTIRIERIDVRAVAPAAPVSRPSPTRRAAPARSSLDDYLASRR